MIRDDLKLVRRHLGRSRCPAAHIALSRIRDVLIGTGAYGRVIVAVRVAGVSLTIATYGRRP